jgi:glycerophosphoryl diester phosphodiesterase
MNCATIETRPLLLGHRGVRSEKTIPENTFAAFDLALASGCDGFEFDVRLSGDGQAVICHDATVRASGLEIAKIPAGRLALPLLEEVLARYRRKAFLDIELKVAGLEKITAEVLRNSPAERGVVVSSFLPEVIAAIHRIDPSLPLGLICENQSQFRRWRELPVEYVIPHQKLLRPDLISKIKSVGKKILAWTVNSPAAMRRFSKSGVDGIVSDNPKQLVRILGAKIASGK